MTTGLPGFREIDRWPSSLHVLRHRKSGRLFVEPGFLYRVAHLFPGFFILLALFSCGPSDQTGQPLLVHLDPRLENGSAPADILAGVHRVLDEQTFSGLASSSGGWRISGAKLLKGSGTSEGVRITRRFATRGPEGAVRIAHRGPLKANRYHLFEVDLAATQPGRARLVWRRTDEPRLNHHWVEREIASGGAPQTLSFFPGIKSDWSGEIAELRIEPDWETPAGTELLIRAVRKVEVGFRFGFEPLEDQAGDGGLVEIGGDARRCWPSDLGVPLFAACKVPSGGRFLASAALFQKEGGEPVRFVLDAREGDDPWERVAEERVTAEEGWHTLQGDLAPYSGKTVALRMTALKGKGIGPSQKAPLRAACLWGEPMVIATRDRQERLNILLITLDTTRADHVGDPARTPLLARLGREGIVFENAWSGCNSTTPSHASILTGVHVLEHGALDNRTYLSQTNTTLAERFRRAGYHTGAAVSVRHLQAGVGFGQGFDRFRQADRESQLNGGRTVEPMVNWIREWGSQGRRPFFLWLHLFDPHIPYGPPDTFQEAYADTSGINVPPRSVHPPTVPVMDSEPPVHLAWLEGIDNREHVEFLYEAGVFYADRLVERVLDALEASGFLENTAVVITADHGESLGARDIWYDHAGLFNESLRIPLILRIPGKGAGQSVPSPVSNLDVAPTLLNLAGLEGADTLRGMDLMALTGGGGDGDRRMWFEYARLDQVGLRDSRYHFITTLDEGLRYGLEISLDPEGRRVGTYASVPKGTTLLFDVRKDPSLMHDLSEAQPEAVAAYLELVKKWRQGLRKGEVIQRAITAEEEERLQAIGYGGM